MSDPSEIVEGAYCALKDLRKGDIRLPSYMGDGTDMVKEAADEIDSALGHLYVTPIQFEQFNGAPTLKSRPSRLRLKKINWLIASGRIMLDMAASGEQTTQHAYGMGMLKEGLSLLKELVDGEAVLVDAIKIPVEPGTEPEWTGPRAFNEDPESLVEAFYQRRALGVGSVYLPPIAPYGTGAL